MYIIAIYENYRLHTEKFPDSKISSLQLVSVAEQIGLILTWSKSLKTGFLTTRLKYKCFGAQVYRTRIHIQLARSNVSLKKIRKPIFEKLYYSVSLTTIITLSYDGYIYEGHFGKKWQQWNVSKPDSCPYTFPIGVNVYKVKR